jgi:hypothetical protein
MGFSRGSLPENIGVLCVIFHGSYTTDVEHGSCRCMEVYVGHNGDNHIHMWVIVVMFLHIHG